MDVEVRRAREAGAALTFAGFVTAVVGLNLIATCQKGITGVCLGPANDSPLGFILTFAG